jgi:hypothetical protein
MHRDTQVHDYSACFGARFRCVLILDIDLHARPLQSAQRLGVDVLSIDGFECKPYSNQQENSVMNN